MVARKLRKARKKVQRAKRKREQKKFQRELKRSRKRAKRQEKVQGVKNTVRSKTAPARIEAKATKEEARKLKEVMTPDELPGARSARKAQSFTEKAAQRADRAVDEFDELFAADWDGDGVIDEDELGFGFDFDGDGQVRSDETFGPLFDGPDAPAGGKDDPRDGRASDPEYADDFPAHNPALDGFLVDFDGKDEDSDDFFF